MKTSPWVSATRVARSGPLAIAISMLLVAAADALEVVPDPVAWVPYPDEAGARWVWVTAVGGVSFDGAFGDVTHVDADGWVRIEERRAEGTRWMVATPVAGTERPAGAAAEAASGVRIDYVVDGRTEPWDDEARAWLADLLTDDPERIEWLRARERDGSGTSGANLTTSEDVWVSLVHVAPSMRATFGTGHLGWTLFGLGGPHPIDPKRPRLATGSIDVATEAQAALFLAHHLAAHDLVAPNDLEAFLHALAAQLRALDGAEPPPVGR
jgi:hypothetical protein